MHQSAIKWKEINGQHSGVHFPAIPFHLNNLSHNKLTESTQLHSSSGFSPFSLILLTLFLHHLLTQNIWKTQKNTRKLIIRSNMEYNPCAIACICKIHHNNNPFSCWNLKRLSRKTVKQNKRLNFWNKLLMQNCCLYLVGFDVVEFHSHICKKDVKHMQEKQHYNALEESAV